MSTATFHKNQFLPQFFFIGAILISFVAGFWTSLAELLIRWDSGDNSYGYLVIPLFVYLCWEERKTFHFEKFTINPFGTIPILLALGLILIGEFGSVETLVYAGMWGCIVGTFFFLYGWRCRPLIFSFIVLLFIIPLPPYINNMLTFKLKILASNLSVDLLRLSGVKVFLEGNIIDLGASKLQVVDACSGLRYVMPMFLMALLLGHQFTAIFWRKLSLVVLVLPISVTINAFRIYATGMLTEWGYPELAENFFHDFAGMVIFLLGGAALLLFVLLVNRLFPPNHTARMPGHDFKGKVSTKRHLAFASMAISILFVLGSFVLNSYSKTIIIPDRTTFEQFPTELAGWQGTKIILSQEILDQLWSDDYVNIAFTNPGKANRIFLLIPYYEYQETRHTAHAPESCMLGGGWSILASAKTVIKPTGGESVPVMKSLMQKGDHKLISIYFFLQRGKVITSPWMNKFHLMLGAMSERRTDGALVRIEMTVSPGQSLEEEYVELQQFFSAMWPLLPDYIPN
nr:VPLPA-CTERM-specific exosortase XrtD [Desulfobulbaceae bacterium]